MAKLLFNRLERTNEKLYLYSALTILMTWILALYVKASTVGIVASIEQSRPEFINSIIGFTIYQLWIYIGFGIIHGTIGGIFLKIDLRRNLGKIKKTSHNIV